MRRLLFVVPLLWIMALAVPLVRPGTIEAQGEEIAVNILDFAFDPGSLEVTVGTTVTWTNNDSAPHTVTAEDGRFDSGVIDPGGTFSFTFDEEGSFPYLCTIHPRMTAAIEVIAAAEEAEEEVTEETEEEVDEEAEAEETEETAPAASPVPPVEAPVATGEPTIVGVSVDGGAAIWIMGQIDQRGGDFSLFGYVNHVEGMETASLFSDPDPANWNESTARFTVFGSATMLNRFVLAERIFAVSAEGSLQFFFNEAAGASFAAPESFLSGDEIAEADLTFRSTISVYAPQEGIADGSGAFTLTSAESFTVDGSAFQLGQVGQRHGVTLTGLGTLSDPTEPRATLDIVARTATIGEPAPEAEVEAADDQVTIDLGELNASGISGTATLEPSGEGTEVTLQLAGATGGHPAHIHQGTCENLDPNPAFPLESVAEDGSSVTTVPVTVADLTAEEFAINVHDSVENVGLY
ncbi:MAG: plastocyanin/azurin family copper-binding protein, partial [Thermomicrobiales bacterium]